MIRQYPEPPSPPIAGAHAWHQIGHGTLEGLLDVVRVLLHRVRADQTVGRIPCGQSPVQPVLNLSVRREELKLPPLASPRPPMGIYDRDDACHLVPQELDVTVHPPQ